MILEIQSNEQYVQQISNNKVLLDVWAEWCSPCKMMNPIIYDMDEMLIKNQAEIKILKLNTDNGDLIKILNNFGINSIPTFIVLDNGVVVDKVIGALSRQKFNDFVARNFV
jgi:thioredoxin 1